MPTIWTQPKPPLVRLAITPKLASWNAKNDPEQQAVQRYLADVESAVRAASLSTGQPIYLRVHAQVSEERLLMGHDVENYLTPLAQRLKALGIVAAHGTKATTGPGHVSLGIAGARRTPPGTGWSSVSATATGSSDKKQWKHGLRRAILDALSLIHI